MHRFQLHNDDLRDTGDPIVSPGQVGLMNGWGIFSTIRVQDGVMFAWERHWARMRRDAARMRVPFPEDEKWLEARLYRLIEKNHAANSTLRVVIVRNRGGMWEGPSARAFDTVAFTAPLNDWGEAAKLGIVPNARHAASEFAGTKYNSWAENLTRYERAHEQGSTKWCCSMSAAKSRNVLQRTSLSPAAIRSGRLRSLRVVCPE